MDTSHSEADLTRLAWTPLLVLARAFMCDIERRCDGHAAAERRHNGALWMDWLWCCRYLQQLVVCGSLIRLCDLLQS